MNRLPMGLTRSNLWVHAAALAIAGVIHWTTGTRLYFAVGISFAAGMLSPYVRRWYSERAPRRAKLATNLALLLFGGAVITLYLVRFSGLRFPPPNPLYWLVLAFVFALPLVLVIAALSAIRNLLKPPANGGSGAPAAG